MKVWSNNKEHKKAENQKRFSFATKNSDKPLNSISLETNAFAKNAKFGAWVSWD